MSARPAPAVLFAPGHRAEVLRKLPRSAPDAVVIDLEDSVPAAAKPLARENARDLTAELAAVAPALPVYLRVNPAGSPFFEDDLAALPDGLAGVVLPKLESPGRLARIPGLPVIAGIETAAGVARVERLLVGPVVACYFGAEDFVTDMGGRRTPASTEVLYARSRVALAARLANVVALDQAVVEIYDTERFRRDAAVGRAIGYAGKLCLHPAQVPLAQAAFGPSAAEAERAERIIRAYEAAGEGVIVDDGQMIDGPLVQRARAIVDAARRLKGDPR
ncbi:HpcH/HpaI aldolase/citrate lyase family protein [Streptosporangium sp. NPDC004631]